MSLRRLALFAVVALAGLALAVGVTTAATQLTSQRIGLESEPLEAGEDLAPRQRTAPEPARGGDDESGDDDESGESGDDDGRGRGRGRGRGGDDDD